MIGRWIVLAVMVMGSLLPAASGQSATAAAMEAGERGSVVAGAGVEDAEAFFDDSTVHEVRIYFDDPDWYDTLYEGHANDPDDPYFPARFEAEGTVLEPVGVRFKGNSSFSIPTVKKSFKIDFDEYDEDNPALQFQGLKKLNLNNSFKDPTMLREKLFLDFAGQFVPAIRAVHTRVYVNDVYWGLYTAVEQVDKTFVQSRFGDDEDGNLFEADPVDGAFGADLTWLGSDPAPYHDYYILKTNEAADDYAGLIELIDILNNAAADELPALLEPVLDVEGALYGLALNNLFVNLDSYTAGAHNYYLYDRDDTGRFTHIHWDSNEAFGRFLMFVPPSQNPLALDPFWMPSPPPNQPPQERPLMERLWQNEAWASDYLCALEEMLDGGFDAPAVAARVTELADLIRADVYADTNKMYSNSAFETNLTADIVTPQETIYGLVSFVGRRASNLRAALEGYTYECVPDTPVGTLFINELMADNATTLEDPDEPGEYPDWFEIYNAGTEDVDLNGLYLTDDMADPTKHAITTTLIVPAGGWRVFYADEDVTQGADHVGFKLSAGGEELALYDADAVTMIDGHAFGAQATDVSEGRCPDGGDTWASFQAPTAGASNGTCGAPAISGTWHTPASPGASEVVTVTATITDDGGLTATSVFYRVDGGGWTEAAMAAQGGDVYSAQVPAQPDGSRVDYYVFAADDSGLSSTDPAGAPGETYRYRVGYQAPVLYLNEVMADNDAILEDPDDAGEYPDWFEIYNPGSEVVALGGLYLTDDLTEPTQFQIPEGVSLPGGGYVLFYADGEPEQGGRHASFKLSADGEALGLFGADGVTAIDTYTFGPQATDVAEGRCPDGGETWAVMASATPGGANACEGSVYRVYLPVVMRLTVRVQGCTMEPLTPGVKKK